MKSLSAKRRTVFSVIGIIAMLSPVLATAGDSSQTSPVVIPINLTIPLLPTITVVTSKPINDQGKILVIIPEAGGLLGIARLSGGI